MPQPVTSKTEYVIEGLVVDRATQRPVPGARVEAWDRDTRYHDLLGQVVTDVHGAFTISFGQEYFGDYAPDRAPDVFYKVFLDDQLVLTTFEHPQRNLGPGLTRVKLELDLPQPPPPGKDRISAEQALKALRWWQASDFRGVFNQGRDQTRTVGKLAGALVSDAFKNLDFKPIRPHGAREREVVNQTPDNARRALAAQKIEVTDVKPVATLAPAERARLLAGYPLRLNPGDRVTLYEENGMVAYYTRDPKPVASTDAQTVARIDGDVQVIKARVASMDDLRTEIDTVKDANVEAAARSADQAALVHAQAEELARLRSQLESVQQANAGKDLRIAKLQTDLALVTQAQDALAARLPLDRLAALEQQVLHLTRPALGAAVDVVAPGAAVVTPAHPVVPGAGLIHGRRAPARPSAKRAPRDKGKGPN
jgi:hypothetical protein